MQRFEQVFMTGKTEREGFRVIALSGSYAVYNYHGKQVCKFVNTDQRSKDMAIECAKTLAANWAW